MSEFERLLLGTPKAPAATPSGAGVDEFERTLLGTSSPAAPVAPASPDNAFQPQADPFEQLLLGTAPAAPTGPQRDYVALLSGGVSRNWAQMRAAPHTLSGIASELSGDTAGMQASLARAQEIENEAGNSQWNLQNINNFEDFTYWLTEKFGENALTLIAAMGTGGAGALVGRGLASGIGASAATRAALIRAGTGTGIVGSATALETPGTAQEQFEVTGSTQPQMSIPAGVVKGLLEAYTPMRIFSALSRPGRQLGATIPGAIASTMAREGATEAAQESIDIALRKYSDPNYLFFGEGPTLTMGEGAWRLAEATAAGAAIGGVIGGPASLLERGQENRRQRQEEDAAGGTLGSREIIAVSPEETPPRINPLAAIRMPDGTIHEGSTHTRAMINARLTEEDDFTGVESGWMVNGQFMLRKDMEAFLKKKAYTGAFTTEGLAAEDLGQTVIKTEDGGWRVLSHKEQQAQNSGVQLASVRVGPSGPRPSQPAAALGDKPGQAPLEDVQNMLVETPPGFTPPEAANRNEQRIDYVPELTQAELSEIERNVDINRVVQPMSEQEVAQGYNRADDIEVTIPQYNQVVRLRQLGRAESDQLVQEGQALSDMVNDVSRVSGGGTDVVDVDTGQVVLRNVSGRNRAFMRDAVAYAVRVARERRLGQEAESAQVIRLNGPITNLRNMVIRSTPTGDRSLQDVTTPTAREDLFGASPLLRSLPMQSQEAMLDLLEANTKRYAVEITPGTFYESFVTDTDLELASILYGDPQSVKPKIYEVDQASLQPAGITATLLDLPPVASGRVWFLPGVNAQRQPILLQQYRLLQEKAAAARLEALKGISERTSALEVLRPMYGELLTEGLRVVPSRGASLDYNLMFKDKGEVEPTTSGRTTQTAFLDLVSGVLRGQMFEHALSDKNFVSMVPVSLDLNKFKEREVSALPYLALDGLVYGKFRYPDNMPEERRQSITQEAAQLTLDPAGWTRDNILKFRYLMREGMWLEPAGISDALVTLEDISDLSKFTPGVNLLELDMAERGVTQVSLEQRMLVQGTKWAVEKSKVVLSNRAGPLGLQVKESVDKLAKIVDSVLAGLGINKGVLFTIGKAIPGFEISSATAHMNEGRIHLNLQQLETTQLSRTLDQYLYTLVMHEVGHLLTYHYYSMLPSEQQQKLRYAYNKALLLFSLDPESGAQRSSPPMIIMEAPSRENYKYFMGYSEWLAEQFRRWATSSEVLATEIDFVNKEIAQKIEKFFKTWAEVQAKHGEPARFAQDLQNPDYYFSAFMQYLKDYSNDAQRLKQLERQQALYITNQELYRSPQLTAILSNVEAALASMRHMIPQEALTILFNDKLDPKLADVTEGAVARVGNMKDKLLLELAVGSLKTASESIEPREVFAHELIHVYSKLGLITPQEMETLFQSAIADKKVLSSSLRISIATSVRKNGQKAGLSEAEIVAEQQRQIREETVAYYVQNFVDTGLAQEKAKPILEKILALLQRVKEFLGIATRDQILHQFFRGEMLTRGQQQRADKQLITHMRTSMHNFFASARRQVINEVQDFGDGLQVAITREEAPEDDNDRAFSTYVVFRPARAVSVEDVIPGQTVLGDVAQEREILGTITVEEKLTGMQVSMQRSNVSGLAQKMQAFVENEKGKKFQAPEMFTPAGFRAFQRRFPEGAKYWAFDNRVGYYYSAKTIRKSVRIWRGIINTESSMKRQGDRAYNKDELENARLQFRYWSAMERKLPKDISQEVLDQMFMLGRNVDRDGVQGSITRASLATNEAQLQKILRQDVAPGSTQDAFEKESDQQMQLARAAAAKRAGIDFDLAAPPLAETMNMRKIYEIATGLEAGPEAKQELMKGRLNQEADRIGFFTRIYWSLHQLVWRNEHIPGLRDYVQYAEMFNQTVSSWHSEADEVARAWEKDIVDPKRRQEFADMMFWLSEMKYRSPAEVAAGVKRHPTTAEFHAEMRRRSFNPKESTMMSTLYAHPFNVQNGQPDSIFGRYLTDMEMALRRRIQTTVHTPAAQQAAMQKLNVEMLELRNKPFFPMVRFGKYSITVRSPTTREVLYFATYDRYQQRDAAIIEAGKQFRTDDIIRGRVPEEFFEFMGLPAPLLRAIREDMPNLTPAQEAWLEDFEMLHVGDRTFRNRWLTQTGAGTPGYSADAFRTFAHFFMTGSRYLARVKHKRDLENAIGATRASLDEMGDQTKRRMIVDYMVSHNKYMMESGRDWAKTKAFISLWQLGFSPAAAMMNLTQVPVVTLPYFSGYFGNAKSTKQILSSYRAARNLRNSLHVKGSGNYQEARLEAIKQGRIDIGQAADLGAYGEGANLLNLVAGSKAQKWWRNVSWYGMWMFQRAEQVNREVTFHAAWELAKANPTIQRLSYIRLRYRKEIANLQTRLTTPQNTFSEADAVAFLFAKEAIDKTQGIYAPYGRPKFLRNPSSQVFLIFFQYVQMMTYVARFNPGAVQFWLIMAFMYGLAGMPGAEDLNEIIRLLGQKIFGVDWDVKHQARRVFRDLTRGTVLDEVGPDLLLHGISRYGFGLGLLPEGYALGQFDASGNGSLGKLVPGLYEALHNINTKSDSRQFTNDVLQRLAGAGFGYAFSMSQWGMENTGSADSHTWERLLPRAARAAAKAARLSPPELGLGGVGAETTRNGAAIARFSPTDPEDMAAVIAQALGFSPTKVTATWELIREQRDTLAVMQARRLALYGQFDYALRSGSDTAQNDAVAAIQRYNDEIGVQYPSMAINVQQLRQSILGRNRARTRQEQLLPNTRNQIPVGRDIQDLFPNVRPERVR